MDIKALTFTKICRGLYTNLAAKMSISHEIVWKKDEGRKWVAHWHQYWMNMDQGERSQKFDTMAQARDFLKGLA